MDSRGFFGLLTLFAAVQVLLLAYSLENRSESSYLSLEAKLIGAEKAAFSRTEAELLMDRAIDEALTGAVPGELDSEAIERSVSRNILRAADALGLHGLSVCRDSSAGESLWRVLNGKGQVGWRGEDSIGLLDAEGMGALGKAVVAKSYGIAIAQYTITGGPSGTLFPCAEILEGNATIMFRIPVRYTATRLVPFT